MLFSRSTFRCQVGWLTLETSSEFHVPIASAIDCHVTWRTKSKPGSLNSRGRASGSGGGNDIKRLLSLLQTQLPYFTRFSFLCASFGHSATESMYVLGQKGSRRWINFLNFKTFLLNPCVRPLE